MSTAEVCDMLLLETVKDPAEEVAARAAVRLASVFCNWHWKKLLTAITHRAKYGMCQSAEWLRPLLSIIGEGSQLMYTTTQADRAQTMVGAKTVVSNGSNGDSARGAAMDILYRGVALGLASDSEAKSFAKAYLDDPSESVRAKAKEIVEM